jgi:purine nucleosidase
MISSTPKNPMIIDTDAGVDDAIALMMALAHPAADLLGITTVHGNVDVNQVVTNVGTILDQMGTDVPIYKGCARPLVSEPMTSAHIHGEDGLGGIRATLPPTRHHPESEHAALALIRLAREHAGNLTLLALGPLTNLALAIRLDPNFASNVSRLVVMGGAFEARGNAAPSAEFNILADAEAASIVFDADFPDIWLSTWETTLKHPIPWARYDALTNMPTARAAFFAKMTAMIARLLREEVNFPGFTIPDPLAAVVALDPTAALETVRLPVSVETHGVYGRGLTSVDWNQRFGKPANVRLVLTIDQDIVDNFLQNALNTQP